MPLPQLSYIYWLIHFNDFIFSITHSGFNQKIITHNYSNNYLNLTENGLTMIFKKLKVIDKRESRAIFKNTSRLLIQTNCNNGCTYCMTKVNCNRNLTFLNLYQAKIHTSLFSSFKIYDYSVLYGFYFFSY